MGGGTSCSLTCGDVGSTTTQLLSYNGMYSLTSLEGNWHQIFAVDNRGSGASSTYEQKYTVGYSKTLSRTEVNEWSVGLSAKIEDITISAGYKNTVTKYSEETWSSSVERDLSITVPAHEMVDYEQRTLVSTFHMNSDVWVQGTGDNAGFSFKFSPEGSNGFHVWDNNGDDCGSCHYNSGNVVSPVLGFNTNCYTTSQDASEREAFCPSPTKGQETELLFGSEPSLGLLSMIKVNVPGETCNVCSLCKEQLEDSSKNELFTQIGHASGRSALQVCLNTIVCTDTTSAIDEACTTTTFEDPNAGTELVGETDEQGGTTKSGKGFLVLLVVLMTIVALSTSACAFFQYQARQKEKNQNYALMNSGF